MKPNKKPTLTQYTYLVNSLLTAYINRNGTITDTDIEKAVKTTLKVYDMLIEAIGDNEDKGQPADWLADYPWDGTPQRYTDIMEWLTKQGVTSKRRQSEILKESIENGFIKYDSLSKKYIHTPS